MFKLIAHDGIEVLESDLLKKFPEIIHGFSTRQGGVSQGPFASLNLGITEGDMLKRILINRRRFCNALHFAPSDLVQAEQIHSNQVLTVTASGINNGVDGLVTNQRGIFLSIKVADCAPILFYDPVQKVIAAAHAGWRGTVSGIIENTVNTLLDRYGSQPSQIIATVGPALHVCCYEVQSDVANQFSPEEIEVRDGKRFLNLSFAIHRRLLKLGLSEENIDLCELCTACNPQLFYSYRRDGDITGRMMGVIGLNSNAIHHMREV